jgi:hypothetical protein
MTETQDLSHVSDTARQLIAKGGKLLHTSENGRAWILVGGAGSVRVEATHPPGSTYDNSYTVGMEASIGIDELGRETYRIWLDGVQDHPVNDVRDKLIVQKKFIDTILAFQDRHYGSRP